MKDELKATWTKQSSIETVGSIRACDNRNVPSRRCAVELHEQLAKKSRGGTAIAVARSTIASPSHEAINLVNNQKARREVACATKCKAQLALALAHVRAQKLRARDGERVHARSLGACTGKHRLASSRWAVQ